MGDKLELWLNQAVDRKSGNFRPVPLEILPGKGIPVFLTGTATATGTSTSLSVTVGSVTIASVPNLTVASMPALVCESAKGVAKLASGTVANPGPTTIFTAGGGTKYRNGQVVISPNELSAQTITVWHGTAADANVIFYGTIDSGKGPVAISGLGFVAADTIIASTTGTTTKTTVTVYGESY